MCWQIYVCHTLLCGFTNLEKAHALSSKKCWKQPSPAAEFHSHPPCHWLLLWRCLLISPFPWSSGSSTYRADRHHIPHRVTHRINTTMWRCLVHICLTLESFPRTFLKSHVWWGWRQKLVVQLLSHRYQQTYGQGGGKCVTSDSKPDCTPNQHLWFTNGAHLSRTHCEPRVAKVPQEAAYQEERNHIINMTPQKGGCFPERLGLRTLLQRQLCWLLLEMTFQMLQPHPATPKFSQEDNYLWRSSVE